ncbi:MAG: hypothetical protein Q4B72_10650 [Lachnospiraceae bacterium]|nr:hypothetical protein [Lachnospiraceae bacterium]
MKSVKTNKWSEGWQSVEKLGSYKGWLIEIGYNPGATMPYCVQWGGAGHYFSTARECKAYAQGKGWINGSWSE